MPNCELGLIGLAVMGQNLVLNVAGHGFPAAVFNRTTETARKFMRERVGALPVETGESLKDFVALLKRPRSILIMVKAGKPVDEMIEQLLPLVSAGDLIADCGNSFFQDTERRGRELSGRGIIYMGIGVSGGEEGALKGPSIMPGGPAEGYERLRSVLEAVAAKTGDGPCVTHVGPGGAGHYVKMVHNGVEYGDMQLIAESYDLLKRLGGLDNDELAEVFAEYNKGVLNSYLIEITSTVLRAKDPKTGKNMVDVILDSAGQKGTGQWTSRSALELSEPAPTICAAVDARNISARKDLRLIAEKIFPPPRKLKPFKGNLVAAVESALYASRLSLYAQGMSLLQRASAEYHYSLKLPELARIWKGGCIIRSALLDLIKESYSQDPSLASLLLAPKVAAALKEREPEWRRVALSAVENSVPAAGFSSALEYFDAFRAGRLPANLVQAQRDYFGAHTFERIDQPGSFHQLWPTEDGVGKK